MFLRIHKQKNQGRHDWCFYPVQNPYNGFTPQGATALRIIRDSVHVEDDKALHKADTMYYIPLQVPVINSTDPKKPVKYKTVKGEDSTELRYFPVRPKEVLIDFNDKTPM